MEEVLRQARLEEGVEERKIARSNEKQFRLGLMKEKVECAVSKFSWKDVLHDVILGIPVGISCVPQGVVFAELANLPPQWGLYSGFMGPLLCSVFGSKKELSVGPVAVIALLLGLATAGKGQAFAVVYANTLCLLAGVFSFIVGISGIGFVFRLVPKSVITGLISAATLTILCAQFRAFLGMQYVQGYTFLDLIANFGKEAGRDECVDLNDVTMAVVSLAVFFTIQKIRALDLSTFHKRILGSRSLYVVVLTLVTISNVAGIPIWMTTCGLTAHHLNKRFGSDLITVGKPVEHPGIPSPTIPSFWLSKPNKTEFLLSQNGTLSWISNKDSLFDEFDRTTDGKNRVNILEASGLAGVPEMILIVFFCVVQHVFVCDRLKKADEPQISTRKELTILGIIQILGAFFKSMPVSAALNRSSALARGRAKTNLAGFMSFVVVFTCLHFFTPVMHKVAKPALGALVFTGIWPMLQLEQFFHLWKSNQKADFISMVATFIVSLLLGVHWGFVAGIAISMIIVACDLAINAVFPHTGWPQLKKSPSAASSQGNLSIITSMELGRIGTATSSLSSVLLATLSKEESCDQSHSCSHNNIHRIATPNDDNTPSV